MACNFGGSKSKTEVNDVASLVTSKATVFTIDQIMEKAENLIGQEVLFEGLVNHVCAHSGKRCILKNSTGSLSIRVEATGNLEGFNKEIVGNDIKVTGILREKRMDIATIDQWEIEVKAKQDAEKKGEHCSSEMANIKEMRDWMKANNKDYYAIYYIDGIAYELVK